MHPVLRLDEVISIIVRQGLSDGDLAALAQVSRSFSTRALDVLWSELSSMIPLLRCLPSGLVRRRSASDMLSANGLIVNYTLGRPFTAADWDIFLKYARRVVRLEGASPESEFVATSIESQSTGTRVNWVIDQSVFEVLCSAPGPRPLFPKLRQLRWIDSTAQDVFWFLRFLLSPSVTRLSFHTTILDVPTLGVVSMLPQLCPSMKHLSWDNQAELSAHAVRVSSSIACAWDGLRELTCPALNSHALQHLSSLSTLDDLDTTLSEPFPDTLTLDSSAFPIIDNLALSSPPHHSLGALASFVRQLTLYPISLELRANTTSGTAIQELTGALAGHHGSQEFEFLRIYEFHEDVTPETHHLTTSMLRPAFRVRSLTCLTIDTERSVMLDDAGMLELVDALPELMYLSINERGGWCTRPFGVPLVTLHGLLQIVARLHFLEKLTIAINAESSVVTENDLNAATNAAATPDKRTRRIADRDFSLNLLDSRAGADNVPIVAALLSDMFANLEQFTFWSFERLRGLDRVQDAELAHAARVQASRWSEVQSLMRVMREVRRHEKARWTNDPDLS